VKEAGKVKMVFGLEAVQAKLEKLAKDVEDGTIKDLTEVTQCTGFKFSLPEDDVRRLDECAPLAYEVVVGKTKGRPAAGSAAPGPAAAPSADMLASVATAAMAKVKKAVVAKAKAKPLVIAKAPMKKAKA